MSAVVGGVCVAIFLNLTQTGASWLLHLDLGVEGIAIIFGGCIILSMTPNQSPAVL
jgi:hypothetical protein